MWIDPDVNSDSVPHNTGAQAGPFTTWVSVSLCTLKIITPALQGCSELWLRQ